MQNGNCLKLCSPIEIQCKPQMCAIYVLYDHKKLGLQRVGHDWTTELKWRNWNGEKASSGRCIITFQVSFIFSSWSISDYQSVSGFIGQPFGILIVSQDFQNLLLPSLFIAVHFFSFIFPPLLHLPSDTWGEDGALSLSISREAHPTPLSLSPQTLWSNSNWLEVQEEFGPKNRPHSIHTSEFTMF